MARASEFLRSRLQRGSIGRNVGASTLAFAVGHAIQLGMLVALSHLLSLSVYAQFIAASAIIPILEKLADFGSRMWGVQGFATQDARGILGKSLTIKGVMAVGMALIVPLFAYDKQLGSSTLLLCVLIATTQPDTDPLLWYLRAKERMDVEASFFVLWRIGMALVLPAVVYLDNNLMLMLGCWLAINLLRVIIEAHSTACASLRQAAFRLADFRVDAQTLRLVVPIGISGLLLAFVMRLGILLTELYGSPQDLAVFGTAFSFVMAMSIVGSVTAMAFMPRLARSHADGEGEQLERLTGLLLNSLSAFYGCIGVLGLLIFPRVDHFLGKNLAGVGEVMVLLIPVLVTYVLSFALSLALNIIQLSRWNVIARVIGISVMLITFLLAPPGRVIPNAAFAWLLGEIAVAAVCYVRLYPVHRGRGLLSCGGVVILSWASAGHYFS